MAGCGAAGENGAASFEARDQGERTALGYDATGYLYTQYTPGYRGYDHPDENVQRGIETGDWGSTATFVNGLTGYEVWEACIGKMEPARGNAAYGLFPGTETDPEPYSQYLQDTQGDPHGFIALWAGITTDDWDVIDREVWSVDLEIQDHAMNYEPFRATCKGVQQENGKPYAYTIPLQG